MRTLWTNTANPSHRSEFEILRAERKASMKLAQEIFQEGLDDAKKTLRSVFNTQNDEGEDENTDDDNE